MKKSVLLIVSLGMTFSPAIYAANSSLGQLSMASTLERVGAAGCNLPLNKHIEALPKNLAPSKGSAVRASGSSASAK